MIILPQETNLGEDITMLCMRLQRDLAQAFGGCTATASGLGLWKQPNGQMQAEQVATFTVAMEPTERNAERLKGIAAIYGTLAGQKKVYVRTADGDVHFVMPSTVAQAETMASAEVM